VKIRFAFLRAAKNWLGISFPLPEKWFSKPENSFLKPIFSFPLPEKWFFWSEKSFPLPDFSFGRQEESFRRGFLAERQSEKPCVSLMRRAPKGLECGLEAVFE